MLDRQTEMMLSIANLLTAEDLDQIRATAPAPVTQPAVTAPEAEPAVVSDPPVIDQETAGGSVSVLGDPTRGERERLRTRESKIATQCVGSERTKHDWWPIGTELVGRIGAEVFTAVVVENLAVKSGRSLMITSGPANGRICRTPTRAALEATEHYRQANHLGRAGGVTNGWEFWQPRA